MKRIWINLKPQGKLSLPIAYHDILQGMIYKLLSQNPAYAESLHQQGFLYGNRRYKLFVFGRIMGEKKIEGTRIEFLNDITLEIRTVDDRFAMILESALRIGNGAQVGWTWCELLDVKISEPVIKEQSLVVQMLTPIMVHQTLEDGTVKTYNPLDAEFAMLINDNFKRKFYAAFGEEPKSDITIKVRNVAEMNKCHTIFKGIHLTGWHGEYLLEGRSEYLEFLYYAGIGARNSQGFGLFKGIWDRKRKEG